MNRNYAEIISGKLNLSVHQVGNTIALLEEDATVPFIARYRKERTGGLDEVQIITVRDTLTSLKELDKRASAIRKSLKETGQYTEELEKAIGGIFVSMGLKRLPLLPSQQTMHLMAKAAATVYEAAVENQDRPD